MKKFSFIIIFLITILFLGLSCEKKNLQTILDTTNTADSIIHTPLCDSIYQGEYSHDSRDTIINGTKYAYAMILSEKHILAWREYSEKYSMYRYMELITNGVSSKPYDDPDYEDGFYYDTMAQSPSNRYVFSCRYYETMDIKDEEKIILRFGSGVIYDVEKEERVMSFYGGDAYGMWNYCNQWVVDGEIIFDPADDLE